jgi:hypothetical protein
MVLSPVIILSETPIFEETYNNGLSWHTIETRIHNSKILRDMTIVDQVVHCVNILHSKIEERDYYPFVQFTMGQNNRDSELFCDDIRGPTLSNIVLVRLINLCPK